MRKKILIIAGIIVLGIIGYLAWLRFSPDKFINAFYLVPKDALYIIETDEPVKQWQSFSSSPLWQHLKVHPKFEGITKNADFIDGMISANNGVFSMFGSRHVLISAHMTKAKDYDFLYLVDIKHASKSDLIESQLINLVKQSGYTYTTREYNGAQVHEFTDKATRDVLYMSFLENNLSISYAPSLVEKSIDAWKVPALQLGFDEHFREADKLVTTDGMCRLFLNFNFFDKYLGVYMDDTSDVKDLFKSLFFSGFDVNLENDNLMMDGYTLLNDSTSGYLRALALSGKGEHEAQKVLSDKTSFMLNLGFDDFETFYKNLENVMKQDANAYAELQGNMKKVEKLLKIDIRKNFFGWIGNEVALAQYHSDVLIGNKVHNIIAIKASDIGDAKTNLDLVEKQIRKRTPLKFLNVDYHGYPVKYLEIKGLFKAMFGKLFGKVEKPYYTIIKDYVIFSDDPKTLLVTIDDFIAQNTLSNNEEFRNFNDKFPKQTSVMAYVSPLHHFANFKGYLSSESWKDAKKNQDYIKCFPHTGFGLSGDGAKFRTVFSLEFKKWNDSLETIMPADTLTVEADTLSEMQLFLLKNFQQNMLSTFYTETGQVKTVAEMDGSVMDGSYVEFYENGKVRLKGKYRNGLKDGVWKYYNENGSFDKKEKYQNGDLKNGNIFNRIFGG
ncbi:MAG: DUF3352 domain-containing protein [Bacteroidia bacterium]|nr:DUF3352 domain-containing protein [Bacteroidia bacterium]